MHTAVITDSVACLPEELAKELGVAVVPIALNVNGREVLEGELQNQELLKAKVKTSAPSPGDFEKALAQALKKASQALVITVSKELSASYQSGLLAAREYGSFVKVLNSQTAASAQGLVVMAAAREAEAAEDLELIYEHAHKVSKKVRLMGAISDLQHLTRTGRIPAIAGWAGRQIGIKPLFEIRESEIKRLLPARSLEKARAKMIQACLAERPSLEASLHLALIHSDSAEQIDALQKNLEPLQPYSDFFIASFNQSLLAAAGTGVFGLSWWWEEPKI